MNTKLKNAKGFTIIEVLIVLAIAGLIMLVVFLAVPALQRNQKNTSYKAEANRIAASVQEFMGNNPSATVPASTDSTTLKTSANADANISIVTGAASRTPTLTLTFVSTGTICPASVSGTSVTPTTTGASTRSVAIIYAIESSSAGSLVAQCQTV